MLNKLRNFHFIGIGGAGMSAIAHVLIKRGYNVSGSDLNAGRVSARLASEGHSASEDPSPHAKSSPAPSVPRR